MKYIILITVLFLGMCSVKAQELNTYVQEALKNSPLIQAYEFKHEIATEKIKEVNTLPDTQFSAGYFVSEPETRTGAQKAKIGVKQMLPWFGTITARENYVNALADVKYQDLVVEKRKLTLAVSKSYYDLFAIHEIQEVLKKNIGLLETYEKLALNAIEVGKASAVDVLRLQIRQNRLTQQKEILEQDYLAEQTNFNNLLNRSEASKVIIAEILVIPEVDQEFSIESLKVHPELTKYDKLFESVEKSELLNKKEKAPKIGFGLDYIAVSERTDMDLIDNGKDIIMPMVSLSIPIFNKKYKSKTKQNSIKQQEIEAQKEYRFNMLETLLDKAVKKRVSSKISHTTQLKNLKQAKSAEVILMKNYETGKLNFNDILDIQELQLKFQTNQINAIKNYFKQSAIINYLKQ